MAELKSIGRRITDCCMGAGLEVEWSGEADDMIVLKVCMLMNKLCCTQHQVLMFAVAFVTRQTNSYYTCGVQNPKLFLSDP